MVDESDKKQQTIDEQSQISPEKQTPNKKDKKKEEEEQLSEEDAKLKTDLELLVERLKEDDSSLYEASLNALKESIKNSTSSMTAVPHPSKSETSESNLYLNESCLSFSEYVMAKMDKTSAKEDFKFGSVHLS